MAVGIRTEVDSMFTPPAECLSVARSSMSDSHGLHHRRHHGGQPIEHYQHLVKWFCGMTVQPATKDTFLMLAASFGTTETAWLSDTGAYGHCACEMWALFRSYPLHVLDVLPRARSSRSSLVGPSVRL